MTAQTPGPVAKLISDLICACEENPCRIAASAIAHDAEDARLAEQFLTLVNQARERDKALRTAREALGALTYAISKVAYFAEETRVGRAIKQAEGVIAAIDEVLHG